MKVLFFFFFLLDLRVEISLPEGVDVLQYHDVTPVAFLFESLAADL